MSNFNVHLYREMRLVFGGIEADTPEAAATIARDKATEEADSINDCEGETLAALVDLVGDEEYEQSQFIDFEKERQRKAAPKLLMAVRMAENYLADDLDEDDETEMRIFKAICDARAEANAAGIRAEAGPPAAGTGNKPYSVLLLYPDYLGNYGEETYYAFVEALDPIEAVALAQGEAAAAQDVEIGDPADFAPLLVTRGHHPSEPLSNQ